MVKKVAKKTRKAASVKPIGVITHYYGGIKVGIFKFKKTVKTGDELSVKGATTDFKMKVGSMQYNHKEISKAPAGKQIGIKITKRVRVGDEVFEA